MKSVKCGVRSAKCGNADSIIVELKAVEKLLPIHEAQLVSYLKLGNKSLGLLINFNVAHLKDGIKRMANGV
jgi:GxxExxY protein